MRLRQMHWLVFAAAAVLSMATIAPAFAAGGVIWGT